MLHPAYAECRDALAAAPMPKAAQWPLGTVARLPELLDRAGWPAEQLWLHPDLRAFSAHRDRIEEALHARLGAIPRGLRAGPPGCATVRNVADFLAEGQPDRAWRLAARLCLAARSGRIDGFAGQLADDLAVSALLLAGDVHGCVLGAVEAAAVMGDLADRATAGAVHCPGLGLAPAELAVRICRRRQAVLDRAASRVAVDGGSAQSIEGLMWRAPVAQRRSAEQPGEG
ncbi:hypothetical protein [Falsiroseomonas sp.]|uniref:hypothetical protein n=1 Tax=Falsiroseomonas sp. TaxID=2870721 RepID=UPI0035622B04